MTATRGFLTGFIVAAGVAALYGDSWIAALTQGVETGSPAPDPAAATVAPVTGPMTKTQKSRK